MELEGSCHCGAVKFTCVSQGPVPFAVCHCGICRKTQGPYNPNLLADAKSLKVTGQPATYRATLTDEDGSTRPSKHERKFCDKCGCHLWAWNENWPDLLHPLASAIDNDLPPVPKRSHFMTDFRKEWVPLPTEDDKNTLFPKYPNKSLEQWHRDEGLFRE